MNHEIVYSTSAQRRLEEVVIAMAPCFRDKFDFSDPKQHDLHADMAVLAAKALIRAIDKESGPWPGADEPKVGTPKIPRPPIESFKGCLADSEEIKESEVKS